MGIDIALEDESGNVIGSVADPTNILGRLLSSVNNSSFRMLSYVDPYGDTVFNRLQVPRVLEEIDLLVQGKLESRQEELLEKITELAGRSLEQPHLYLKFYGD